MAVASKPKSKYGNRHTLTCLRCSGTAISLDRICISCGGDVLHLFDSKAESARYAQLHWWRKAKQISNLVVQPEYPIEVAGVVVGKCIADFSYTDNEGHHIVEDIKGGNATDTAISKFKRKCVVAQYGINIQVVRR